MLQQLKPIVKKEFRQVRRDKRVLTILTLIPALLLLLNGYALNFDVKHITMAVYDGEKSKQSREFVQNFISSGYFDYTVSLNDYNEVKSLVDEGKVKLALVIPTNFSRELLSGREATVQVIVDGMDANSATTIIGYAQAVTLQYSQKIILQNLSKIGRKSFIPINYQMKIWYNPELKSAKFLVPGLIAFILAITGVIATSLSIVKEKERNTIEQINVSPIRTVYVIIGKMIPYAVISLIAAALVILSAYVLFDVTVKGSLILLFIATTIFIVAALAIGLLVSTISDSQQVAFQIASLVSMLPSLILSGFMFPIRSMPLFLQILSNITPAKFYLVIMRSIVLKGVGLEAFWEQILYLCIFITVVITIAVKRFKRELA